MRCLKCLIKKVISSYKINYSSNELKNLTLNNSKSNTMKAYITILVFLTFFGFTGTLAQTTNWLHQSGTNIGYDKGLGLAIDAQENSYLIGSAVDTIDMDPSATLVQFVPDNNPQTNRSINFIQKVDPSGNVVWTEGLQATGSTQVVGVKIMDNQYLYVAGWFDDTLKVGMGTNQTNYYSASDGSYLIRMDLNGNIISTNIYDNNSNVDVRDLAIDSDNNIILAGYITGTSNMTLNGGAAVNITSSGAYDCFIAKYDEFLNLLWAERWGGNSFDQIGSVTTDVNNNILATGTFLSATVDFDPGVGTASLSPFNSYDGFVLKLSPAGDFKWVKQNASNSFVQPRDIVCGDDNEVVVTGDYSDNIVFDYPNNTNFTSIYYEDSYIWKLDSLGNTEWTKTIGGTGIEVVNSLDIRGNRICVAGLFTDSTNLQTTANPYYVDNLTSGIVVIYDLAGNFVSALELKGSGISMVMDVKLTSTGLLMTGGWVGINDFDLTNGTNNLSPIFGEDFFLMSIDDSFLGITEEEELNNVTVYPNPVKRGANIELTAAFESVVVYNIFGEVIYSGTSLEPINAAGVYLLKIETNEGVFVKRLVVKE